MTQSLNKNDLAILKLLCKLNGPVYQNDIPKLMNADLRVVTRSLYKLEKMRLISREPAVHNKRRTYLIKVDKNRIIRMLEDLGEILSLQELFLQIAHLPCIACQHVFKCYEGGFHDPLYCPLLANYVNSLRH